MIDINNYLALKAKGAVTLSKTPDGTLNIVKQVFDSDTGQALPSDTNTVTLASLNAHVADLQARINQINQIISDAKGAPVVSQPII